MDDGAKGQPVAKRGRHISNLDVAVALGDVLSPLLQAPQPRLSRHLVLVSAANWQYESNTGVQTYLCTFSTVLFLFSISSGSSHKVKVQDRGGGGGVTTITTRNSLCGRDRSEGVKRPRCIRFSSTVNIRDAKVSEQIIPIEMKSLSVFIFFITGTSVITVTLI